MSRYTIRSLSSEDFAALATLENDVFAAMGEAVLCPHYLRLCTEIFHEVCFIAYDGDRAVGRGGVLVAAGVSRADWNLNQA